MVRSSHLGAAALLVLAAACSSNDTNNNTNSEPDSGTESPDAQGPADAVVQPDAGQPDASPLDGTAPDALTPDAMPVDAMAPDAMPPDSGPRIDFDVLQHHKNATRDGVYVDPMFTRAMAPMLHQDMGFNATVPAKVYAQPLYFANGPGGQEMVIVATESNQVIAFNAASGSTIWSVNLGTAAARGSLPCGNITPTVGVTGTPVIDPARRTLYVAAMVNDGGVKHRIFSLSLDDGSSSTHGGWPVDVSASFSGMSFSASVQNQRGALALVNGVLYVPYGGHYGDCSNYHGWVIGVRVADTSVSSWATTAYGSGIWAPGGVSSDGTNVYVATGNGMAHPDGLGTTPSTWSGGEAIIRLQPGLGFGQTSSEYFAPPNWMSLDTSDADLGGVSPVLFDVPGATPSQLTIGLGKNGQAYLVDRTNLGGIGAPLAGPLGVSQSTIITAAAAYRSANGTYVALHGRCAIPGRTGDLVVIKVNAASPPTLTRAWCAATNGVSFGGSPMVTMSDTGGSDAIVWMLGAGAASPKLFGFDADSGNVVFNGGGAGDVMASVQAFQTPIAVNGRIYVAGNTRVYAFTVR